MSTELDPNLLDALSSIVAERSGLRFGADRRDDLERGVRAASEELGYSDPVEYAASLVSSRLTSVQIGILASHLTIGETYFFREKASFQLLEERILPELIHARREGTKAIRIWSAGCCTGEEPYSVAISLSRLLPNAGEWDISIRGTDINERFLQKAREAVYGDWSFRDTPPAVIEAFFAKTHSGRRRLLPHVRRLCTFEPLNLVEDIYPSCLNGTDAVDLILCRNVLIYFDEESAARLVRNMARCLAEGGWLLVGAAEASQVHCQDLLPAQVSGTMAFRKRTTAAGMLLPERPPPRIADQTPAIFSKAVTPAPAAGRAFSAPSRVAMPVAARTPLLKATASYEQRHYAEVIAALLPLCTSGGGDSPSLELLTRAYANLGNPSQALAWCEKAISADKLNPKLHYLRAAILQERGELAEAAASFRRAIYLDPEFIMAHFGAGHVALRVGKRREAAQQFARARLLLGRFGPDQTVPEAEGLDARHLAELIEGSLEKGKFA